MPDNFSTLLLDIFRWILDTSPNHKNYGNVRSGKVYVSHDVTNFEFLYEPFYVAKDIVPPHDERFMGYGYTRNTQVRIYILSGLRRLRKLRMNISLGS